MTAVLTEEDVVRLGSGYVDLGRIGVAKAELDKRVEDLGGVKGKARAEPSNPSAPAQIPEELGVEDDIMVDFGTKVDRPSPAASFGPVDTNPTPAPTLGRSLPKAAARIRKASPVLPMPFSQPGSGSSTPIGDSTVFLPASGIATPGASRLATAAVTDKKDKGTALKKKKRTKEIDDLFGGLSGSEKKRKVVKRSPTPPDAIVSAEQDVARSEERITEVAKTSPVEVGAETKRIPKQASEPGNGKPKKKKKKKKGDDLDDIFGF